MRGRKTEMSEARAQTNCQSAMLCAVAIAIVLMVSCGARAYELHAKVVFDHSARSATEADDWEGAAYGAAERKLSEVRGFGLRDVDPDFSNQRDGNDPSPPELWVHWALWLVVTWLGSLVLLVAIGEALSMLTLRFANRGPAEGSGQASGLDPWLRRTYRSVLAAMCVYYFVSLPLVVLMILGFGALFTYFSTAGGYIRPKGLVAVAIVVGSSLYAMFRSLVLRPKDRDPGERLVLSRHPELRAVLDEVASKIGTRPVDSVYVTPNVEVAVLERGGLLRRWTGASERCLVLGTGVLEGMKIREFKAILAHEYGHFRNEDTAGGGLALAVRHSLGTFAEHLEFSAGRTWLNPAWWFVCVFVRVFHRTSRGATRLQEMLADRWSAFAYGSEAFARGLSHVVTRTIRFAAHVQATVEEALAADSQVTNVYSFVPVRELDSGKINAAVAMTMSRRPAAYDSHPPPADRIARVNGLNAAGPPLTPADLREAWTLLSGREDLERRMTSELRAELAGQGLWLSANPSDRIHARSARKVSPRTIGR
jgi:Zn-dependent protease with chaperone function